MLGQRRRRWANIKTSLFQRVVFAGRVLLHNALSSIAAGRGSIAGLFGAELEGAL